MEFLFLNIFNLQLVEPADVEPVHVEGRLYPFLFFDLKKIHFISQSNKHTHIYNMYTYIKVKQVLPKMSTLSVKFFFWRSFSFLKAVLGLQ